MTTLTGFRREPLSLAAAVTECASLLLGAHGQDVVGLAYSPNHCSLVQLRDARLFVHASRADSEVLVELAHDDVFECRLFSASGELRWWHPPTEPSAVGIAVYLSEASPGPDGWPAVRERVVERRPAKYLLWGEGMAGRLAAPGWSWLSAARIGPMAVPIEGVAEHARVRLDAFEYVDLMFDDHGNAVVVEERLVGLQGA